MKFTVYLKSGQSFDVECEKFKITRTNGEITGHEITGSVKWMAIDPMQIAAVVER